MAAYDSDVKLTVGLEPENVIKTAQQLNADIDKIFARAKFTNVSTQFKAMETQMDRFKTKNQQNLNVLRALWNLEVPTDEFISVQERITKVREELVKVYDAQEKFIRKGGDINSLQYKGLENDVARLNGTLDQLQTKEQELVLSGKAMTLGQYTPEFQKTLTSINQTSNGIVVLKERMRSLKEVRIPMSISSVFDRIARGALSASTALLKFSASLPIRSLKLLATQAKNVVTTLAKMASNAIISGIKKLGSAIAGIGNSSKKSNNLLKVGLRTFIKYAFGVRSFFFLFRKIRTAIVSGFGDLAQVHEPFNQAMSSMVTALTYLKNTIVGAFAPLIEVASPIVVHFTEVITDLINKFGMLMASLTGKEFVKALPVQQNYAESVANSAKNANAASKATAKQNKAAKELKRTIAGFDDVEILHEDKDTPDNTETAATAAPAFTTGQIAGPINDFANRLKEMWGKADFTDLGRIIGEKLRDALNNIPWDAIKEILRKVAKSIATFLNGFLEVPGLFDAIGRTLAQALNSAFEFLNSFVTNFHWDSLGNALRDLILGVLNNIDWPLIYDTVAGFGRGIATTLNQVITDPAVWTAIFTTLSNTLRSLALLILSFATNLQWGDIGKAIGTGLNNGVATFPFTTIANALIKLVNGAIDLLYNFVTTFDFFTFGASLGQAISLAISNIEWGQAGATIAKGLMGLLDIILGLMENIEWEKVGIAIATFISEFLANIEWDKLGTFISDFLTGLFNALKGFIETINWDELPEKITTAISQFLEGFDWDGVAEAAGGLIGEAFEAIIKIGSSLWNILKGVGNDIMEGGFEGILEALKSVKDWIVEHIFNPFIKGFKDAFDIGSPSKKMKEQGGFIIDGMLNGIINALSSIGTWIITNIFNPIVRGFKSAFGLEESEPAFWKLGHNLIVGMQNGISNITGKIFSWIKTNIKDPIVNGVKRALGLDGGEKSSSLYSVGSNLIEGLKNGITNITSGIGNWLDTNLASPITDAITSTFGIHSPSTVFADYGGYMVAGLKDGISDAMDAVTTLMYQFGESMMKELASAITAYSSTTNQDSPISKLSSLESDMESEFDSSDWYDVGSYVTSGLYAGIQADWYTLTSQAWDLAVAIYNAMCSALGIASPSKEFRWIGGMINSGLATGIKNSADTVLDSMSNVTQALIDEAENTNPALVLDSSMNDLNNSIDNILSSFSDTVIEQFTTLITTLEDLSSRFSLPAVVSGMIGPYSVNTNSSNNDTTFNQLLEMINNLQDEMITKDDLADIITAIQNIPPIYLGDEQIARHANNGNRILNRRYKPSTT